MRINEYMMNNSVSRLKALADPSRLKVLALISSTDEMCVCKIEEALKLPQPTVSRHLNRLKAAGWLQDRRAGKWVYYRLADPAGSSWCQILEKVLEQSKVILSRAGKAANGGIINGGKGRRNRASC